MRYAGRSSTAAFQNSRQLAGWSEWSALLQGLLIASPATLGDSRDATRRVEQVSGILTKLRNGMRDPIVVMSFCQNRGRGATSFGALSPAWLSALGAARFLSAAAALDYPCPPTPPRPERHSLVLWKCALEVGRPAKVSTRVAASAAAGVRPSALARLAGAGRGAACSSSSSSSQRHAEWDKH